MIKAGHVVVMVRSPLDSGSAAWLCAPLLRLGSSLVVWGRTRSKLLCEVDTVCDKEACVWGRGGEIHGKLRSGQVRDLGSG